MLFSAMSLGSVCRCCLTRLLDAMYALPRYPVCTRPSASIQEGRSEAVETFSSVYKRAVEDLLAGDPTRSNRALACVYLPEDVIDNMKSEVHAHRVHRMEQTPWRICVRTMLLLFCSRCLQLLN
jgi:hypothetical protein